MTLFLCTTLLPQQCVIQNRHFLFSSSSSSKGFEARHTDISDRSSGLSHFYKTTNSDHFYTLPRQSKRSVGGLQGPHGTLSSTTSSTRGSSHDVNNILQSSTWPSTRPSTRLSTQGLLQNGSTETKFSTGSPVTDGETVSNSGSSVDGGSESYVDPGIYPEDGTSCMQPGRIHKS